MRGRSVAARRGPLTGDRGALAPFAAILIPVLLVLGGLVVDGSRELNTRAQAQAYAEEAARAGATAVVGGAVDLELDQRLVRTRVDGYCQAILAAGGAVSCQLVGVGAVSATDNRQLKVTVLVKTQIPTTLLGIVGVPHLTASGQGSARPYEGVTAGDAK